MAQSHTTEVVLPSDGSVDMQSGSVRFIRTSHGPHPVCLVYTMTDPNFLHRGESVHWRYGGRSRRLTEPALIINELPPLDLVLSSQIPDDYFDRRVERDLNRASPIGTTAAASGDLSKKRLGN